MAGVVGAGVRTAVPVGVHDVVLGVADVEFLGLLRVHLLDELGRDTAPQFAVAHHRVRQHQRTGGHDGPVADDGMVEHGGAHADEGTALHLAAVEGDVVAHCHVVADDDGRLAIERVQAGAVLDVYAVADFDVMHVAAQDGVEPHRAVVAHGDVADDGRPFGEVAVLAELRGKVVEFLDDCHVLIVFPFESKVMRLAGFPQPDAVLRVEQGSELCVHLPVVAVEPCVFFRGEHGPVDGRLVDGAEGERLEAEELAELRFLVGQDELRVLDAHAVAPGLVDARFVGHGHVGEQRCGHVVHAYLVRPFVDAEAGTHAVPRAVEIVDALLPHGVAGADIELRAVAALWETGEGQTYVPPQHQRVVAPLLFSDGSEGDGAGQVGGGVVVLCAGIQQQQALGAQGNVGLRRGLVVYDGPVGGIARYGVEAVLAIQALLAAQFVQLAADAELSLSAGFHGRLQPAQELHHGHAVAHHGAAVAFHLGRAFHGLEHGHGGGGVHHVAPFGQGLAEHEVDAPAVEEHAAEGGAAEVGREVVVVARPDIGFLQMGGNFRREFHLIYI